MSRRAKSEIIGEILFEALEKSTKTKIRHRANLNMHLFPKYLEALQDRNYIECFTSSGGFPLYRTTDKGRELLKNLKELKELITNIRER